MFQKGLEDFIQNVENDDREACKAETKHDVLTHFVILSEKHQGCNVLSATISRS